MISSLLQTKKLLKSQTAYVPSLYASHWLGRCPSCRQIMLVFRMNDATFFGYHLDPNLFPRGRSVFICGNLMTHDVSAELYLFHRCVCSQSLVVICHRFKFLLLYARL